MGSTDRFVLRLSKKQLENLPEWEATKFPIIGILYRTTDFPGYVNVYQGQYNGEPEWIRYRAVEEENDGSAAS